MTVSGWGGKDSASDAAVGGRTCFSSPPSLISELMFAKVEGNEVGWGAFISQQKNSNSSIHDSLLNHPAPLFFLDLANSDFPVTCLFLLWPLLSDADNGFLDMFPHGTLHKSEQLQER